MQRHAFCAAALFFLSTPFGSAVADALYGAPPPNINAYLDKLVKSYPDWIQGYDAEYLILKNGTRFKLSDHRGNKSFEEIHEHPDIDDMFYVPYPAGTEPKHPLKNFDPGRVRFEPLFCHNVRRLQKERGGWETKNNRMAVSTWRRTRIYHDRQRSRQGPGSGFA
jgi:hypothetical protein